MLIAKESHLHILAGLLSDKRMACNGRHADDYTIQLSLVCWEIGQLRAGHGCWLHVHGASRGLTCVLGECAIESRAWFNAGCTFMGDVQTSSCIPTTTNGCQMG